MIYVVAEMCFLWKKFLVGFGTLAAVIGAFGLIAWISFRLGDWLDDKSSNGLIKKSTRVALKIVGALFGIGLLLLAGLIFYQAFFVNC